MVMVVMGNCSLEIPDCVDADYEYNVNMSVVGENCHPSNHTIDSTLINVPLGARYSVEGEVWRGNPGQCQTNEDFYLEVNSELGPETSDDADPCAISVRLDFLGEFNFTSGLNNIKMHTASTCPPDTHANSVDLKKLCLFYIEECGNGILDDGEECDDGNNVDGDGCDSNCSFEFCGDGIVQTGLGEECDDGNQDNYDDCRNDCTFPYCGDGILDDGEECDDGNNVDGDGCDSNCSFEFCGDGIVQTGLGEECDDGNQDNYDDCRNDCTLPMINLSIKTCSGEGELYLYQGDPFQEINTSFVVNRDQLLIFARGATTLNVKVDDIITPLNLITEIFTPFHVKVYSVNTSIGSTVSVDGEHQWNARGVQGYLAQNILNPVYNISKLQVIIDDTQTNTMYLIPGNYSYVFFDKYSINKPGEVNDTRKLNVIIEGLSGLIINKTFTHPSPVPVEGVVVGNFVIDEGDEGNYTLSVDTEDSIYWPLVECPQYEPGISMKDAKVAQAMPTVNFGNGRYMMVNPKTAGTDRSYIRLDLTGYNNDHISTAFLNVALYYTGGNIIGSEIGAYYCPDHDFNEMTINWYNQPFDSNCNLADVYTINNTVVAGIPQTWHTFDLTDEVNDELTNGDRQFTVMLKSLEEGLGIMDNSKYVQYLTKEYPEEDFRPKLVIS
jgi:cysteine-rich repeat protein